VSVLHVGSWIVRICFLTAGRRNCTKPGLSVLYWLGQYNLIPANTVISLSGKLTVGLVESNVSLPPGL